MKKILKKSLGFFLIFCFLFSSSFSTVMADFDWPAPPDAASQAIDGMLKKFSANEDAVTETVQTMNVLKYKKQEPQMTLIFSPANPNPGEKITATATPMNFGNDPTKMYYTWYLRHAGEDLEEKVDGEKPIEIFKKRAARIIAGDGFEEGDYTPEEADTDKDGYEASFGGDDQRGKGEEPHCFFHDTEKGAEYEFRECKHLFPGGEETGDGSFKNREEAIWNTDPNDDDTADNGQVDEATVAGLGQVSFTWTYQAGDQVGVVIEGVSFEPTMYEDSSYKVMWALPKNTCELPEDAFDDPSDMETDNISISPATWPSCTDGCDFTRTITQTNTSYKKSPFSSYQIGKSETTTTTQEIHLNAPLPYFGGEFEASATGGDGGDGTDPPTGGTGGDASVAGAIGTEYFPPPIGTPDEETCLATDFPGVELTQEDKDSIDDRSCCPAGDGEVGTEGLCEEVCEDKNADGDTEDEGECESVCEAATWSDYCAVLSSRTEVSNNQMGVEPGTEEPLNADDCEDKNEDGDTEDEEECDEDGKDASAVSLFKMTMDEFNDCLVNNLVDPTEGGANKKTEVSLSYYPKNPINDPEGNNSDDLNVDAVIIDSNDQEFLYYKWEVYATNEEEVSDETNWGAPITKNNLTDSTPLLGLGAKSLRFKLNFPDTTYLKVKLAVSEKAYNGEKKGHSDVIIPIAQNQDKISVYLAKATASSGDDVTLSLGDKIDTTETANGDAIDSAFIDVAKNQIIGLEIPETTPPINATSWVVDGKPLSGTYPIENDALQDIAYFPVTQEVGKTFNASLSATKEDGTKINLTRAFRVVDPGVKITSENEGVCVPKLLGYYIDTDDVSWPDYNPNQFQAMNGATVSLKATFEGNFAPEDSQIIWTVDGSLSGTGESVSLETGEAGNNHNVSVQALYAQDNATAKALDKFWRISYDGLYETNVSDSISIDIVNSLTPTEDAREKTKLFLATIVSGFPAYLSFLIRIILTTGLFLFSFKTILSLLRNKQENV